MAEDAGGAASAAAALHRFHQRADHRIHPARRRPQVRRGRGADGRLRPLPRREHLRDGPGEGRLHRIAHQAQFRHGAPRRLSQGGAADGDGRALRHSRAVDRRFRRRLSRHRRRRAWTGRGDRALDRCLSLARRAQCRDRHRRGHVGRRDRDHHRQPRADVRARDLQRDLAGSGVLDPLARRHQGPGSRQQHEDHRPGHAAIRRDRHHPEGARRRRPSRPRRHDRGDRRGHRPGLFTSCGTSTPTRSASSGGRNSSISAGNWAETADLHEFRPKMAQQRRFLPKSDQVANFGRN